MALALGVKRCWFHPGKMAHYDIPPKMRDQIVPRCRMVSSREIVRIIKVSRLDGSPTLCVRPGRTEEEG